MHAYTINGAVKTNFSSFDILIFLPQTFFKCNCVDCVEQEHREGEPQDSGGHQVLQDDP